MASTLMKGILTVRIMVIIMLNRQTVVKYLQSLSQDEIAELLLAANVILWRRYGTGHTGTMDVWQEFLRQTLDGDSLNYAEKTLGLTHQTAFNMRHKLLMALEDFSWNSQLFWGMSLNLMKPSCLTAIKGIPFPKRSAQLFDS